VINTDHHHKEEKCLVLVSTPCGEIMWVHPDIIQNQPWTTVAKKKSKCKARVSHCNMESVSSREAKAGVTSLTDSKEEEYVFIAD